MVWATRLEGSPYAAIHTEEATALDRHSPRGGRAPPPRGRGTGGAIEPLQFPARPYRRERLDLPEGHRRQGGDVLDPAARRGAPSFPRLRQTFRRRRKERSIEPLSCRGRPMALVPDADIRLPNLPGDERARDRREDLPGARLHRLRGEGQGQLAEVGVLRPVSGERLQLRVAHPRGMRDLLFFPPRVREAHARPRELERGVRGSP